MKILSTYKFRISFVIGVCIALIFTCIAVMSTGILKRITKTVYSDRALYIVESASKFIDGNKYEEFLKTLDPEDQWYKEMCFEMNNLVDASGCEYLYAMTQISGYDFIMVLDGEDMESENFSKPGTHEDVKNYGYGPLECMKEKNMIVADVDRTDEWGWTQSVYYPILNSKNATVGIIGCDFDATELMMIIRKGTLIICLICFLGFIFIEILVILILRRFFRRLFKVTNAIEQMTVGQKDLTAQVPIYHNNEISRLTRGCNSLMENLKLLMINVKDSMTSLANNTDRLVDESSQVTRLTESAANNFQDISRKAQLQNEIATNAFNEMENVQSSVERLANQLNRQGDAVGNSTQAVSFITQKIVNADKSMQKISSEYQLIVQESDEGRKKQENITELLAEIEEMSVQLTDANTMISAIAEQTNLLAMNAAIEAAHAGESGKGFSVVADEIRKLAETSAEQTLAIEQLISATRNSIALIVESANDSSENLSSLANRIKNTSILVDEIQQNMEEQNVQVGNITNLMQILDETEKEINSSSHEMTGAFEKVIGIVVQSKKVADEILDSSLKTSEQIENMHMFTKQSEENSRNNFMLVNNISTTINQYKTE